MKLDGPLVLATQNEGKIAEFRGLLAGFDVEIRSLKDYGPIPQVEEDGDTFEDNAVKKARFTARVLGLPALADDSGLMVRALGGGAWCPLCALCSRGCNRRGKQPEAAKGHGGR